MDDDLFDVFDDKPASSSNGTAAASDATAESTSKHELSITFDNDVEIDDIEPAVKRLKTGESAKGAEVIDIGDEEEQAATDAKAEESGSATAKLEELMPRVEIHQLETEEGCIHEVVIPTDLTYQPLRNLKNTEGYVPAKKYEFTLDPFQKEAVLCVENNQSVLVSAHTSAGKTVVAEYAIAQALRDKQRVVYTVSDLI